MLFTLLSFCFRPGDLVLGSPEGLGNITMLPPP